MNFDTIWYWLILLLVGVICGMIGYYWGKGKIQAIDNSDELKALEEKNASLKADLEACTKKLTTKPSETKIASSLTAGAITIAFDAAAAKAAFGKKVKLDDLKIVEGIGPKIEGLFHNFDIKTWHELSDVTVAKCQEVLNSGGKRYRIHDPASWPMQAKLAHKGDWKKLARWQDEHKAGKL